ncbi:hypothetical protein RCL1_001205 [Eukaryota sp. TZLM3-RCL]
MQEIKMEPSTNSVETAAPLESIVDIPISIVDGCISSKATVTVQRIHTIAEVRRKSYVIACILGWRCLVERRLRFKVGDIVLIAAPYKKIMGGTKSDGLVWYYPNGRVGDHQYTHPLYQRSIHHQPKNFEEIDFFPFKDLTYLVRLGGDRVYYHLHEGKVIVGCEQSISSLEDSNTIYQRHFRHVKQLLNQFHVTPEQVVLVDCEIVEPSTRLSVQVRNPKTFIRSIRIDGTIVTSFKDEKLCKRLPLLVSEPSCIPSVNVTYFSLGFTSKSNRGKIIGLVAVDSQGQEVFR